MAITPTTETIIMSKFLQQFWTMLFTTASAGTYAAKAVENVCIVAEKRSGIWVEDAIHEQALATQAAVKALAAAKALK